MKITDSVTLGDGRVSDEGYLVVNAHTARVGVQQYLGSEVGRPEFSVVNVYRDESEVFSKRSLDTFSRIPITVEHPQEAVNASNWRDLAVGTTGDEVLRDGEYLKIGLKITDAAAVKAVQDGKRELSVGYSAEIVWGDGIAPDGTTYQARQTAIAANHIAIVQRGRAGPKARIGDGAISWGAAPINDQEPERKEIMTTLKTVTVDGIPVEVTDQGATVITTLQSRLVDANTKLTDADKAHQAAIAAKDADLAKKDAEIDALKAKVVSDADIDKRVQAKAELVAVARAIAKDVKVEGLSDAAIRKAVVVAKLGDEVIKDKSDVYIDARFDILVDEAKKANPDPFASAVKDGLTNAVNDDDASKAYATMLADMKTAHLPKSA
jgi:hypothetical protein